MQLYTDVILLNKGDTTLLLVMYSIHCTLVIPNHLNW